MLHEPMMMPQGGAMSEVEVRPLLTREEVEPLRVRMESMTFCGDQLHRDLLDALLAAWDQLDAVDRFAADPELTRRTEASDYEQGYVDGYNGHRSELRALLGIEEGT